MTSAKETRYQNNQRELNCSSNSRSYQEANHSKLSRRDFEILNTSRGFSNNLSTSQIFQRFLKSFLKFSKILLRISNTLWDFKIFKFLQDFWGLNRLLRFSRNYQKIFENFVSFVGGSFWDIFRFWKIFRMFVRISKNLLRVLRSSNFPRFSGFSKILTKGEWVTCSSDHTLQFKVDLDHSRSFKVTKCCMQIIDVPMALLLRSSIPCAFPSNSIAIWKGWCPYKLESGWNNNSY